MTFKTYPIKRLWNGIASVREYAVEDCIKNDLDLQIKFGRLTMLIKKEDLIKRMFQTNTRPYISKYDGGTYKICDFKFVPADDSNEALTPFDLKTRDIQRQQVLFNSETYEDF